MSHRSAFILMLTVTAAWGASYMWMKVALISVSPVMLVGLRFTIAFIATVSVFAHKLHMPTRAEMRASFVLGTLLCALFTLVMIGLRTTDAATAGFLLSTTAVFVTIFSAVRNHAWPGPVASSTTIIVVIGLYLLAVSHGLQLSGGALFCVACAALYAVYIMYSDHLARHNQATFGVSVWQLGVAGIEGSLLATVLGQFSLPQTPMQWGAVLALGVICSAFGFVAQTQVQNVLQPETVSLIYTLEPIFSAIFAYLMLGEILAPRQWVGAILIFASVVFAEVAKAKDAAHAV